MTRTLVLALPALCASLTLRLPRHFDHESGPLGLDVLDPDAPAMVSHDIRRYRQAESRAPGYSAPGLAAMELLEDQLLLLRPHSGTGVLDPEPDNVVRRGSAEDDGGA